jgi:hypothetical protein
MQDSVRFHTSPFGTYAAGPKTSCQGKFSFMTAITVRAGSADLPLKACGISIQHIRMGGQPKCRRVEKPIA